MKIKTTKKRILSFAAVCNPALRLCTDGIASAVASEGLCEHHTEHTEDCGYSVGTEASECTHVHTDECYTANKLACTHVHNESCGYIEAVTATPCTFVCKICSKQEAVDSGTIGNSTLCEKHSFGAWTINEESGFERKCTVCGESEASEEPDFMSGLMELETAEEISAELDRLLAAGIIDQKCDDALSSVFSGGAAPLSAEIAATSTTVKYTGLARKRY